MRITNELLVVGTTLNDVTGTTVVVDKVEVFP
jgi:hypothetical protein